MPDVTLADLKGKDAESEQAQEHANSSSLALYAVGKHQQEHSALKLRESIVVDVVLARAEVHHVETQPGAAGRAQRD